MATMSRRGVVYNYIRLLYFYIITSDLRNLPPASAWERGTTTTPSPKKHNREQWSWQWPRIRQSSQQMFIRFYAEFSLKFQSCIHGG